MYKFIARNVYRVSDVTHGPFVQKFYSLTGKKLILVILKPQHSGSISFNSPKPNAQVRFPIKIYPMSVIVVVIIVVVVVVF